MPYADPLRNKECNRLSAKRWQQQNPRASAAKTAQWRLRHPEKANGDPEARRIARAKWKAANKDRVNADTAARRASKLKATPPWVDKKALRAIYRRAAELGLHVDHIYPLKGRNSCGLHVPWNLQLLTLSENSRKWISTPVGIQETMLPGMILP